ncbi:hypothetical protein PIB30_114985, partial [Stylosanthes scabra]|nr:hypothetical protein [Stylosanthes scabra]
MRLGWLGRGAETTAAETSSTFKTATREFDGTDNVGGMICGRAQTRRCGGNRVGGCGERVSSKRENR